MNSNMDDSILRTANQTAMPCGWQANPLHHRQLYTKGVRFI
jgi:hypothetical protein